MRKAAEEAGFSMFQVAVLVTVLAFISLAVMFASNFGSGGAGSPSVTGDVIAVIANPPRVVTTPVPIKAPVPTVSSPPHVTPAPTPKPTPTPVPKSTCTTIVNGYVIERNGCGTTIGR